MLVMKFGGSSVAHAGGLLQAAMIVAEQRKREPVTVVVSAMGGVTDALLHVAADALAGEADWRLALAAVGERHRAAYRALGAAPPAAFELAWEMCRAEAEALASHGQASAWLALAQARFSGWGERLVVGLLAQALTNVGVLAKAFEAEPILLASLAGAGEAPEPSPLATRGWLAPRLAPLLLRGGVPVLPGYIARDAWDQPTTLGRNGSDYSAAIVAAALGASRLVIWSDVPGVFSADPRIVPEARLVPWLTYAEAAAIASAGAKVLHPRTVEPLARWSIPLDLRSARDLAAPGTAILPASAPYPRDLPFVVSARPASSDPDHTELTVIALDRLDLDILRPALASLDLPLPHITEDAARWLVPHHQADAAQRQVHHALALAFCNPTATSAFASFASRSRLSCTRSRPSRFRS